MPENETRVFIIDDHPMIREGIAAHLNDEPGLALCGEAGDVETAFHEISEKMPDLVIMDISINGQNGLALTKKLKTKFPHIKVLVHSMYEESVYGQRSIRAGAMGYIDKRHAHEAVMDAIQTVLRGETYLSNDLKQQIIQSHIHGEKSLHSNGIDSLSDRELEVLTLIGRGKTTRVIASELFLSVNTIDTYRDKLKTKLDLSNGAELNRFAAVWVAQNE